MKGGRDVLWFSAVVTISVAGGAVAGSSLFTGLGEATPYITGAGYCSTAPISLSVIDSDQDDLAILAIGSFCSIFPMATSPESSFTYRLTGSWGGGWVGRSIPENGMTAEIEIGPYGDGLAIAAAGCFWCEWGGGPVGGFWTGHVTDVRLTSSA